mmetsp:Transcript_56566/g.93797  ORF Transcript_56566/g.93797 Transcript_56566/m.93797 type:complete len:99 (-) Transcript_56566:133-429(-)
MLRRAGNCIILLCHDQFYGSFSTRPISASYGTTDDARRTATIAEDETEDESLQLVSGQMPARRQQHWIQLQCHVSRRLELHQLLQPTPASHRTPGNLQ